MAKETAANIPSKVQELVQTFQMHIEAYRSQQYNETQLRREFIDPFFVTLGWDVMNTAGYAHAYKDVIHEDAIKIGGATKAPDYCFRIGGTRKFFLDATESTCRAEVIRRRWTENTEKIAARLAPPFKMSLRAKRSNLQQEELPVSCLLCSVFLSRPRIRTDCSCSPVQYFCENREFIVD